MLSRIKWMGLYSGMGLSAGIALGGILLAMSYSISSEGLDLSIISWKAHPLNTLPWFGVAPVMMMNPQPVAQEEALQAPSFKLFGTSILPSGRWVLIGSNPSDPATAKWIQEGEKEGAYRIARVAARTITIQSAEKGKGEWVLSLSPEAAAGTAVTAAKQDCAGAVKVPRMAIDVLTQQQAMLLQGVEIAPGAKGVRVKPELAALLSGLGFMAGDVITSADGEILSEPHALITRVINPLIQGRSIVIKGQRGVQERQWRLINETACK